MLISGIMREYIPVCTCNGNANTRNYTKDVDYKNSTLNGYTQPCSNSKQKSRILELAKCMTDLESILLDAL